MIKKSRKQKLRKLIVIAASSFQLSAFSSDLPLADGNRIVFIGDSYTSMYRWPHYVSAYLILMNPSLTLHCQTVARSGTSLYNWLTDPTGYHGYDEYPKRGYSLLPNFVISLLGNNASSYTAAQHASQLEDLGLNYIIGQNSATPVLLGPIPYFTTNGGNTIYRDINDAQYTMAQGHGWIYDKLWYSLVNIWSNSANWSRLADQTITDHPSKAANIIIAYYVIHDLGWATSVSTATINGGNATLTSSSHCTISSLAINAYNGVDFQRLDDRLPWAIDEYDAAINARADAAAMAPETVGWQDYSIKVTGLASGNYNVFCDGVQIGTVSNTALASGWNMADLTYGPVFDQVQEVLGRIRDMQWISRVTQANNSGQQNTVKYISNAIGGYASGLRGEALRATLSVSLGQIATADGLIHSAAQPVNRTYSIRMVGATPGSVRLNKRKRVP